MMDAEDQRVKDLQSLAWGLQSLTNKPGNRLPEQYKRDCYKLTSRALSLCSDCTYLEEEDFLQRSKDFFTQLEAKKVEVGEVEEAEKQKLMGKCYRASDGGNYTVGKIADKAAMLAASAESGHSMSSTAGGARALTAKEVVARCGEDPEVLSLCDMGLGDSDVEPLVQGLQRGGANLTSLDVSHNLLADVGVQRLVSALASGACPKLRELHVGFNSFGDLGTQMLKGGLKALRKNLVVHFDDSGMSAASVEASAVCASAVPEKTTAASEMAEELAPTAPTQEGYGAEDASLTAPPLATAASADSSVQCAEAADTNAAATSAAPPASSSVASTGMEVELIKGSSGEYELKAVLPLPEDVAAADDLDLDVSPLRIVIRRVSGALLADTPLPCAVIVDTTQAKFSRKRGTMTLRLQVAETAAAAALVA